VNTKNQPNRKKRIIFLVALSKWILELSKNLYHILFNHMYALLIHERKLKAIHFLINFFIPLQ
jgi:hypothetical protein